MWRESFETDSKAQAGCLDGTRDLRDSYRTRSQCYDAFIEQSVTAFSSIDLNHSVNGHSAQSPGIIQTNIPGLKLEPSGQLGLQMVTASHFIMRRHGKLRP
ncbi:hypothetical protein CHU98_g928 [Xylaria longipes]|nr:hypothetical protein CHU98_g928 [Xylaria longipes]